MTRQTFYIFTSVSILLAFRQLQTGRGFISHVGHLGGLFGGLWIVYMRHMIEHEFSKGADNFHSLKFVNPFG